MYRKYNYFWRLFSFSGKMERGEFWSEVGVRFIGYVCAAIIACIAVCSFIPGDVPHLTQTVEITALILGILWAVPILALTRRRLRDAGYDGKTYLWLLIPVVGWFVFILRLCGNSK